MLLDIFNVAQIGDTYLIAVTAADFWFAVACTLALGVLTVWLARRPQPSPDRRLWRITYPAEQYIRNERRKRAGSMRRHPSGRR